MTSRAISRGQRAGRAAKAGASDKTVESVPSADATMHQRTATWASATSFPRLHVSRGLGLGHSARLGCHRRGVKRFSAQPSPVVRSSTDEEEGRVPPCPA